MSTWKEIIVSVQVKIRLLVVDLGLGWFKFQFGIWAWQNSNSSAGEQHQNIISCECNEHWVGLLGGCKGQEMAPNYCGDKMSVNFITACTPAYGGVFNINTIHSHLNSSAVKFLHNTELLNELKVRLMLQRGRPDKAGPPPRVLKPRPFILPPAWGRDVCTAIKINSN